MIKIILLRVVPQSSTIKIIIILKQTVKLTNEGLPAHTSFDIIITN